MSDRYEIQRRFGFAMWTTIATRPTEKAALKARDEHHRLDGGTYEYQLFDTVKGIGVKRKAAGA